MLRSQQLEVYIMSSKLSTRRGLFIRYRSHYIIRILPCCLGIGFPVAGFSNGPLYVLEFALDEFWSGAGLDPHAVGYLSQGQ